MKVINITGKLQDSYHGCGFAEGKIVNNELISFRYLSNDDLVDTDEILGMLSCYQFCYENERINKEYENV